MCSLPYALHSLFECTIIMHYDHAQALHPPGHGGMRDYVTTSFFFGRTTSVDCRLLEPVKTGLSPSALFFRFLVDMLPLLSAFLIAPEVEFSDNKQQGINLLCDHGLTTARVRRARLEYFSTLLSPFG